MARAPAMAASVGSTAFTVELPIHFSNPTKVPTGAKTAVQIRVSSGTPKRFTAEILIRKSATILQNVSGPTDLVKDTMDPDLFAYTMDAGDPADGLASPDANRVVRVVCYEDDGSMGGAEGDTHSRLFRYEWVYASV